MNKHLFGRRRRETPVKINIDKTEPVTSEVVLITKIYKPFDIDDWVDHYLNWCGFDRVYIVDNESCCDIAEKFKDNSRVFVEYLPDNRKTPWLQQNYYSRIANFNNYYTYQFYCDDDEYLWFDKTKYKNINEFLTILRDKDILQYSIPMVNISYESGKTPQDRTKSMISDCLYVSKDYFGTTNSTYKTFISKYLKNKMRRITFNSPHVVSAYKTVFADNSEVKITCGKDFYLDSHPSELDIKLFHYYHRSLNEWEEKSNRTRIDVDKQLTYGDYPTQNKTSVYPDNEYTEFLDPFKLS